MNTFFIIAITLAAINYLFDMVAYSIGRDHRNDSDNGFLDTWDEGLWRQSIEVVWNSYQEDYMNIPLAVTLHTIIFHVLMLLIDVILSMTIIIGFYRACKYVYELALLGLD